MKEGVISVLMQDPGVTGVGANIHQAYYRLDILEGMAKTLVLTLLLRKNRDYGSSFRKPGILSGALDPKMKLLVRIDDKLERLSNLLSKGAESDVTGESLSDTVTDIIGYLVLFGILLDEECAGRNPTCKGSAQPEIAPLTAYRGPTFDV